MKGLVCTVQSTSSDSGGSRASVSILLPLTLIQSLHMTVIEEPDFVGMDGAGSYCTALTEPRADEGIAFFFFFSFHCLFFFFF